MARFVREERIEEKGKKEKEEKGYKPTKLISFGALWTTTNEDVYSGQVSFRDDAMQEIVLTKGDRIVMFRNKKKTSRDQPEWRLTYDTREER